MTMGTSWLVTSRAVFGADIVEAIPHAYSLNAICGNIFDDDLTVYNDFYGQDFIYITGPDARQHPLYIDLAVWRMPYGNHCLRAAYVSTWFSDGAYGYHDPQVWIWNGSRGPWEFDHGTYWATGNFTWTRDTPPGNTCLTCNTLGPWGSVTTLVTLPNGQTLLTDFGENTGVTAHANTANSHVYDPGKWDALSHPDAGWFVRYV